MDTKKTQQEQSTQTDTVAFVRERLLAVVRGDFNPTPDQMQAMVLLLSHSVLLTQDVFR